MRTEIIGDATLYLGDCREVLPALAHADAVVTDPPYGVGFTGKLAITRNGGRNKHSGGYSGLFTDNPEFVGSVVVPAIVTSLSLATRGAVTPGTRCLMMYPQPADIGCFYSAAGTGLSSWGFTCSQPILYYGKCPYLPRGAKPNSTGQFFPNDANGTGHPCAKPLPLVTWLVARVSLPHETVLDPFMGSGTTGVACHRLGRRFVGVEIDARYFDIACRRITEAQRQDDMLNRLPPAADPADRRITDLFAEPELGA